VENVVYFGTDTHIHLRLDEGGEFIVRQQNSRDRPVTVVQGDKAGVLIGDNVAQVLRD
jgi:spermidine/putrescine transport system ATP-binding protein